MYFVRYKVRWGNEISREAPDRKEIPDVEEGGHAL